jgi:hypothetical protein
MNCENESKTSNDRFVVEKQTEVTDKKSEEALIDDYHRQMALCKESIEALSVLGGYPGGKDTKEYKEAKAKYLEQSSELNATKDALRAMKSRFLELI